MSMGLGLPMGSEFIRNLESRGEVFNEKVLTYDDLVSLLIKKYGNSLLLYQMLKALVLEMVRELMNGAA